jgi:hypothetical protein
LAVGSVSGMAGAELVGQWSVFGRMIETVADGDDVLVRYPGVPAEFLPRIVAGVAGFELTGGSFDGLGVEVVERAGVPHLLVGGTITLPPWSLEPDVDRRIEGLPVQPVPVEAATEQAYRGFLAEVLAAGGGPVRAPAGVPLAGWLRWASDEQVVLFHGTGEGGIDQFVPRRQSYELRDEAGRGNRGAVYATDDAWWALWFAVLDRDRLRGSMRSGVEDFTAADRRRMRVYYFSVDHRVLTTRPWREGWLYVLPREGFERLGVIPGGPPSHEWCCPGSVTPLARLAVTPADFPFLDRVSAHDDGPLLRFEELGQLVTDRATSVRHIPDGVTLRLRWDDAFAALVEEYRRLGSQYLPQVAREVRHGADGHTWLELTGPAQFAAMLRDGHPATSGS